MGMQDYVVDAIEAFKDEKFESLPTSTGTTICTSRNVRVDMQSMTSDDPPQHNIQAQINYGCKITSLAKLAPNTVAHCIVPSGDNALSGAEVKKMLIDSVDVTNFTKKKGQSVRPGKIAAKEQKQEQRAAAKSQQHSKSAKK